MSSSSIVSVFVLMLILTLTSTGVTGVLGHLSGPRCRTTTVSNGICVTLVHCPSLMGLTSTLNIAEFIRQYGCGTDTEGNLRLCCPEEEGVTPVTSTTSVRPTISDGGIINQDGECGRRVVGEGSQWPFITAVGRFWNNSFDHRCNGAIISNQWVSVAAFCTLQHFISHVVPGLLLVDGQDYQYIKVIHKLYQEFTDSGRYSKGIALLKLESPLTFNDYVQPVCLPNANSGGTTSLLMTVNLRHSSLAFSRGWTVTQKSVKGVQGTSKTCDKGNDISSKYKARDPFDLCAEGVKVCVSGFDPLAVKEDLNTGRYELVGIGGYAENFCVASINIYSSVSSYIGWITEQVMNPSSSIASEDTRSGFGRLQCGKRAVGDGPEFSFMVAIGRAQNGEFTITCGGVIVNESWILTEAACVVDNFITHVRVSIDSPKERNVPVAMRRRHESYDPTSRKDNVALLKLETPLHLDDYAQPICLPSTMDVRRDTLVAIEIQEKTFLGVKSLLPAFALVEFVDKEQCSSSKDLPHSYYFDTICATGTSSCVYATRLFLLQRDPVTSQLTVVGVGGKSGSLCFDSIHAYTHVYSHIDWINNNLQ